MFENRMYSKVTAIKEEILLGKVGTQYKRLSDVPDITRNRARNVAAMASSCTDFICFILAAERNRANHLCYRIRTPYTADADKVSMFGQLLAECEVFEDIFYSTVSRSFIVEIPDSPKYTLSGILSIGTAEKIQSKNSTPVLFNEKNEVYYWDRNKGLLRVKLKFNRRLAFDIAGHEESLFALYRAAMKAKGEEGVETIYVVAPEVKQLLPALPTIMALDEI